MVASSASEGVGGSGEGVGVAVVVGAPEGAAAAFAAGRFSAMTPAVVTLAISRTAATTATAKRRLRTRADGRRLGAPPNVGSIATAPRNRGSASPCAVRSSNGNPDGSGPPVTNRMSVECAARLAPVLASDWIEHRRADGETVGWIVPDEDGFRARDLLGREVTEGVVDCSLPRRRSTSSGSATSPTATHSGCLTAPSARFESPRRASGV